MGADCDILLRLVVQLDLLISMGEVMCCKSLASRQRGKKIINERKRMFGHPVNGNFIITTVSGTSVILEDGDDWAAQSKTARAL